MPLDDFFEFQKLTPETDTDLLIKTAKCISVFIDEGFGDVERGIKARLHERKIKIDDLQINQGQNNIYSIISEKANHTEWVRLQNLLMSLKHLKRAWILPEKMDSIQKSMERDTPFALEYLGFYLKGKTPHSKNWPAQMNMTIGVWIAKDTKRYERDFNGFVKDKYGFVLKRTSLYYRMSSKNPGEGKIYYDDDARVSMTQGNTTEPFYKTIDVERSLLQKEIEEMSQFSNCLFHDGHLKENNSPKVLEMNIDKSDKSTGTLMEFSNQRNLSALFWAYFSEYTKNRSQFKIFGRKKSENLITSNMLDIKSGEGLIFQIDDDAWKLSVVPTFSTKPWTILSFIREIHQACPFEINMVMDH